MRVFNKKVKIENLSEYAIIMTLKKLREIYNIPADKGTLEYFDEAIFPN